jgi:transcriptional regulator with XRE-family HTH domain
MSDPRIVETKGRALLGAYLDEGRSQSALARQLGVSPSNVNRWRSGLSRPDVGLREAVRLATGIAPGDWMTDAERAEETERLRRAAVGVPVTPVAAEPAAPPAEGAAQ